MDPKEILNYNPETGEFTWKISTSRKVSPGDRAGTVNTQGYNQIQILGQIYRTGHLAWFIMTGEWPSKGLLIDHINQDRWDDRWVNLRLVTKAINNHNSSARNILKGTSFHRSSGKWTAQITIDRIKTHLGSFQTMEEAHKAYLSAAAKHYDI